MNRSLVNFWLNACLLVAYVLLLWSSTVLHLVFPPGPQAGGWSLWGATYLQWRGLQFAILVVLTLGILWHVMLHWSWVCGIVSTKILRSRGRVDEGSQTLAGVAALILVLVIVGSLTAVAFLTIRRPDPESRGIARIDGSRTRHLSCHLQTMAGMHGNTRRTVFPDSPCGSSGRV